MPSPAGISLAKIRSAASKFPDRRRIVGVIGSIRHEGPEADVRTQGFIPIAQSETNDATVVTWIVPDVEKAVEDLKARGVAFEHYDMPDTTRVGDVHVSGRTRVAWFKDPDGNIHSVAEE